MAPAVTPRPQTGAFLFAVAAILVLGSLGLAGALMGWPGEADPCTLEGGNCYCEAVRQTPTESLVKQPANTWSNIVPIVAGLGLIAVASGALPPTRRAGRPASAMAGGWHADVYGLLVIALGLGSIAFHASLTRLGGWLDTLSMIAFVTYVLVYDVACIRRLERDRTRVVGTFAVGSALLGLGTWEVPGTGTSAFTVLLLIVIFIEVAMATTGVGSIRRSPSPWLLGALVTFAAATLVWRISWTAGPLCDPTSLLQGHALWHILAEAVAPLMLFAHLRRADGPTRDTTELRAA